MIEKTFKGFIGDKIDEKASSVVHGKIYDLISFQSEDDDLITNHIQAGKSGILGADNVNIPWNVVKDLVERFSK